MHWVQRRNRFQHDWLKNRYLLQLGHYLNFLDDLIEDPDLEAQFFNEMLPEWLVHRSEVLQLISDFEFCMSPLRLFDEFPLTLLAAEARLWLSETVHSLWRARHPVSEWVRTGLDAVKAVDRAYEILQESGHQLGSGLSSSPPRGAVTGLLDACRELSRAVAQFPIVIRLI
jgi:hypothetical protein